VIIGSLILAAPTLLQAASHRKIVYIDQYDGDLDGRVSSTEFEMARRERFDTTDTNGNGTVDIEEYVFEWEDRLDAQLAHDRQQQVKQTATRFAALDKDGDGLVSRAEFEASGERSFTRLDSNGDGIIDADDAEPTTERRADMSREQIVASQRRMLKMPSTHSKEGAIAQYDRDGDGAVTGEEFALRRAEFFRAMDADGSGAATADEYLHEFEDRMDAEISRFRKASVEQARVRFRALDADDNGIMSFAEYQRSGHRSFKHWDTDGDGYVSWEEDEPARREFSQDQVANEEGQSA
jgi:Ca2+-binding EF-hand superfamily protein